MIIDLDSREGERIEETLEEHIDSLQALIIFIIVLVFQLSDKSILSFVPVINDGPEIDQKNICRRSTPTQVIYFIFL